MKFSFLAFAAVAFVSVASLSSCKKDDEKAQPSVGSLTYNAKTINLSESEYTSASVAGVGTYTFSAFGETSDSTYTININTLGYVPSPGSLAVGGDSVSISLIVTDSDGENSRVRTYIKTGERVTMAGSAGSRKWTLNNLTETNSSGTAITGGKSISAIVSEM